MLFSIIMSTYNEKIEWLKLSIDSILDQTSKDFEFIIVLDNPQNKEIEDYLKIVAKNDSRIILIKNEINLGLVKSLNKAMALSKGEYIVRMDADDISLPERLQLQYSYLEKNKLDFVFGPMIYINEQGIELQTTNLQELNYLDVERKMKYYNISNHPTWFFKREVYETLKGYRDIVHCEDYDFSLRAISAGYKIGKMPTVLLKYRVRGNGVSQSNLLQQYLNSRVLVETFLTGNLNDDNYIMSKIEPNNKISEKEKNTFNCMNSHFSDSIIFLKRKNYLKGCFFIVKAILTNKYAIDKYMRMGKIYLK